MSVNGLCRFRPQAEWRLFRNAPSLYTSELEWFDRAAGKSINTFQFDRPDILTLDFPGNPDPGTPVKEGDLLARLKSRKQHADLNVARRELDTGKAKVAALVSGEKTSIEEEAIQSKNRAEQVLGLAESSLYRLSKLHDLNLCSETSLGSLQTEKRIAEIDLSITESRLETVRSGEKPSLIAVAESEAEIAEFKIEDLEHCIALGDFRSPIDGLITTTLLDSALLRVAKLDTMIALVPIAQPRIKWVAPGQKASVLAVGSGRKTLEGTVINVDRQAMFIQGKTYFLVSVSIRNDPAFLMPGMEGRLNIRCGKIRLLDWLADKLGVHTFRQLNV